MMSTAAAIGPTHERMLAEQVMGWRLVYGRWEGERAEEIGYEGDSDDQRSWSPSSDIGHAWLVMERVRALGWLVFIGPAADNGPGWSVQVKPRTDNLHHHLIAPTAPLAICHAALYTLGVEV